MTGEFLAQLSSNAENVSIWWRVLWVCLSAPYNVWIWKKDKIDPEAL